MLKQSILILALAVLRCECGVLEISIDTEISDDEQSYHKYKAPAKPHHNHYKKDQEYYKKFDPTSQLKYDKYEDVDYNLVKVSDPGRDIIVNDDIHGFLHGLRKVVRHKPMKGKGKKPIYRQAITLIANSAEKDHQLGSKKLITKIVPKMYMPVPQAISHILGKEHIPYGIYENLSHNYNYAK